LNPQVDDRRATQGLVNVLASSKKPALGSILSYLSRDRLKELRRALDRDDSGKEKAALVEGLRPPGLRRLS